MMGKEREVRPCHCAEYGGEEPNIQTVFGHEYCANCQLLDETDWWDDITPAQRAACEVWENIRDRRGFKGEIDPEIEAEILDTLARIISDNTEEAGGDR